MSGFCSSFHLAKQGEKEKKKGQKEKNKYAFGGLKKRGKKIQRWQTTPR